MMVGAIGQHDERSIIQKGISWVLLALILMFAITSMGNVAHFVSKYHKGWTGWTLGACFGVTLFVSAYIASTAISEQTRKRALAVAIVFGLASATFQMSLYMDGGAQWYTAILLSFVPIVAGEVGLALVESSYSKDHEQEVEEKHSNLLTMDLERVTEQLDAVTKERNDLQTELENVTAELDKTLAHLAEANGQIEAMSRQNAVTNGKYVQTNDSDNSDGSVSTREKKRLSKKERQNLVLDELSQIVNPDDIDHDKLAEKFGTSGRTIRRDIDELVSGKKVSLNGIVKVLSSS
ncbi:DeoR family transcriptional regulator [Chloroflexi bacterium TSY]|nr:DeoR family transcriptional regulator [Chloroflexi bacterium TSY]